MRYLLWLMILSLGLGAQSLSAQGVVRRDELLASDRPEAWAMQRVAAVTLLTGFGETPAMTPGQWLVALDLGEVPRLSTAQRRVGFNGEKIEDLNKTPVFGRLRLSLGLPAGWVAELGYTPPLASNGARPRNLVALSLGHRMIERGRFTLSGRIFGQHGAVEGDLTCPAELVGVGDLERNPYGCQAASDDRIALNDYGVDLTSGWNAGPWHSHASLGAARTELQVQVDALTFDVRDRSRLVANGVLRFAALGVRRDFGRRWSLGAEFLHVPLSIRRGPDAASQREPTNSLRLQLRFASN